MARFGAKNSKHRFSVLKRRSVETPQRTRLHKSRIESTRYR